MVNLRLILKDPSRLVLHNKLFNPFQDSRRIWIYLFNSFGVFGESQQFLAVAWRSTDGVAKLRLENNRKFFEFSPTRAQLIFVFILIHFNKGHKYN